MKPPPDHVTVMARALTRITGESTRVVRTRHSGYRISVNKPSALGIVATIGLLELLAQADRFGDTSWVVWAEFDYRTPTPGRIPS